VQVNNLLNRVHFANFDPSVQQRFVRSGARVSF
jgi:hypothetical protein